MTTPTIYPVSRRTFLRGVGVTMALPWLESLPVWGDEPDPRGRKIAGQERELLAVLGVDFDGLDVIDTRLGAPFLLAGAAAVLADQRPQRLADCLPLPLFLLEARADGRLVIIASLAIDERCLGQLEGLFPAFLVEPRQPQLGADLARHHVTLPLGAPDHRVRNLLQRGRGHGGIRERRHRRVPIGAGDSILMVLPRAGPLRSRRA